MGYLLGRLGLLLDSRLLLHCHRRFARCGPRIFPAAQSNIGQTFEQALFLARGMFGNVLDAVLLGGNLFLGNRREVFNGGHTLLRALRARRFSFSQASGWRFVHFVLRR